MQITTYRTITNRIRTSSLKKKIIESTNKKKSNQTN
jgi:hypothetical protein